MKASAIMEHFVGFSFLALFVLCPVTKIKKLIPKHIYCIYCEKEKVPVGAQMTSIITQQTFKRLD